MPVRVTREGTMEVLPAKLDAGIRKGLHTSGVKVAGRARHIFNIFRPKGTATGALKRSITTSRVTRGFGWYYISVGSGVKYGWYAHEKTGPQRPPPLGRIISWLQTKPGTRGKPIREIFPIAKAVQRKIAARGTSGFPFMTTALKFEKDKIPEIIYHAVIAELRKP